MCCEYADELSFHVFSILTQLIRKMAQNPATYPQFVFLENLCLKLSTSKNSTNLVDFLEWYHDYNFVRTICTLNSLYICEECIHQISRLNHKKIYRTAQRKYPKSQKSEQNNDQHCIIQESERKYFDGRERIAELRNG